MTKEQLAERLNGRQYGDEMTVEEEQLAKDSGLLVVFGASDDLIEFRGAFSDEAGCIFGGEVTIDRKGVLPSWDDVDSEDDAANYFSRKANVRTIKAIWGENDYPWTYKTDIPHATFEVLEDDTGYCRGIVISIADL